MRVAQPPANTPAGRNSRQRGRLARPRVSCLIDCSRLLSQSESPRGKDCCFFKTKCLSHCLSVSPRQRSNSLSPGNEGILLGHLGWASGASQEKKRGPQIRQTPSCPSHALQDTFCFWPYFLSLLSKSQNAESIPSEESFHLLQDRWVSTPSSSRYQESLSSSPCQRSAPR